MNNNCNNSACINGVCCHVCNCVHHTQTDCCDAQKIDVANDKAQQKGETFCSTFSPRSGCCG